MLEKKEINYSTLLLFTSMFICCWNGTLTDSNESKDKRPDVNFYGTIEDHYETFEIEDILIGGKYEVIPVYQTIRKKSNAVSESTKNEKDAIDPKQNKSLIDLKEIKSIELKHPNHPVAAEVEINNRKYIEIIITSINKSKKEYLIESSRAVTCIKKDKGPGENKTATHEERKLTIIHIKKLTIKGYKSNIKKESDDLDLDKLKHESRNAKKLSEKEDAKKESFAILDTIEKQVKNMPRDDQTAFDTMKQSILSLLKSLREQLQKILNMIQ